MKTNELLKILKKVVVSLFEMPKEATKYGTILPLAKNV